MQKSKTRVFTAAPRTETTSGRKIKRPKRRSTFGERLLRNTAIACAILLAVLAVKNIDTEWSKSAIDGIETALTMRVDLDDTLGKLSFVRNIMPESSLVFLNIAEAVPLYPVEGEKAHEFTEAEPWFIFACADKADVRAGASGTVTAVEQLRAGDWCVLVKNGESETLYGYIDKPCVDVGAVVARGDKIGNACADMVYFEARENGKSVNPWQ